MKGRMAYSWTTVPASIVTVEYVCWRPDPWSIRTKRRKLEATIRSYKSDDVQTAKELEEKLNRYLEFGYPGDAKITVRYGRPEAEPKD